MRSSSSYLNNLPLLPTPLGKYTSEQLVTYQLDHTNHYGVEKVPLLVITEGSKESAVGGGPQPFSRYGARLNNTKSCTTGIHSN